MSQNINLQQYWAMGHYKQSFKIINLGAGTLQVKFHSNKDTTGELYYKTGRFWLKYDRSVIQTINVKTCVYFRGSLRNEIGGLGRFELTGSTCSIGGDLVSLCSGITDEGTIIGYDNILPDDVKFSELFGKQTHSTKFDNECLERIENLVLPRHENVQEAFYYMFGCAKNLKTVDLNLFKDLDNSQGYLTTSAGCYYGMFESCVNLENAPFLGSETLSSECYKQMFAGCTNLKHIQDCLPATTLAQNCYENMFNYCEQLVQAPILPARKLCSGCYKSMFRGCVNLKEVTMLGDSITDDLYGKLQVVIDGSLVTYYGMSSSGGIRSIFGVGRELNEIDSWGITTGGWLDGVAVSLDNALSSKDYTLICSSNWQNGLLFNMQYEKYKQYISSAEGYYTSGRPEARNIFTYIVPSTEPRVSTDGSVGSLFPYHNQFGDYATHTVETAWYDPIKYADNYGNIYQENWWPDNIRSGWQIMTESGVLIRDWDGNYNSDLNNII